MITNKNLLVNLLKKYGLNLKKKLGQNYLIDKDVLDTIILSAGITSTDTILEVGAGIGILTQELCKSAKQVIAHEIDPLAVKIIRENLLPECKNLEIVEGDFLRSELLLHEPFKVVANLPYQITTPVIRKLLEGDQKPTEMVIMVQREVAERLTAKPGSAKRGWVTVLVEATGLPSIERIVKPESFFPEPEVDSAILKISQIKDFQGDLQSFLKVVRAGFSAKRRQLINSLAGGLAIDTQGVKVMLASAQIEQTLRAEDLTVEQWSQLTKIINNK